MNKTAFIYIHGVHPNVRRPRTVGYSKLMHTKLMRSLRQKGHATSDIKRFEINWSHVTFGFKQSLAKHQFDADPARRFKRRPGKPIIRNAVRNFIYPFAVDILYYIKNKGTSDTPGEMVILKMLHDTLRSVKTQGFKEVIIFAHSLGSVAAYDYVFRFRKKYAFPKSLKLKSLVTFGSPIALFAAGMGYPISIKIQKPDYIGQWVNFWDPDDPIATRMEPHFLQSFRKNFLKDVQVETGGWNAMKAHTAYWTKASVIEEIAEAIA